MAFNVQENAVFMHKFSKIKNRNADGIRPKQIWLSEAFIGWLWCNCRIWPNVVYFCNIVSHAVHIFFPSVLQRLDSRGIKRSSWSSERMLIYCRYGLKSSVRYCFQAKCFCYVGEKYSDGAKSGKYGGWSTSPKLRSCTTAMSTTDLNARALSWWNRTRFVSFPGRFDTDFFSQLPQPVAIVSPLIVWPFWR